MMQGGVTHDCIYCHLAMKIPVPMIFRVLRDRAKVFPSHPYIESLPTL